MYQSVGCGPELHECAEVHKPDDRAFESVAHHVFAREVGDLLKSSFRRAALAGDEYRAVFLNSDVVCARALTNTVNHLAARTDDEAYLVFLDDDGEDFRRALADVRARCRDFFGDDIKDLQTSFLGLRKSFSKYFERYALHFHIHLYTRDSFRRAGNLAVHIAVMVFRPLNVGEDFVGTGLCV